MTSAVEMEHSHLTEIQNNGGVRVVTGLCIHKYRNICLASGPTQFEASVASSCADTTLGVYDSTV